MRLLAEPHGYVCIGAQALFGARHENDLRGDTVQPAEQLEPGFRTKPENAGSEAESWSSEGVRL
jgi:hypothetical protein